MAMDGMVCHRIVRWYGMARHGLPRKRTPIFQQYNSTGLHPLRDPSPEGLVMIIIIKQHPIIHCRDTVDC